MNIKTILSVVSAFALLASATEAQTLSDLAKQEKSRRAKAKTTGTAPAKVYTDADGTGAAAVSNQSATVAGATTTAAPAAPGGPEKKEKTREELAAEAAAAWNKKVQDAQTQITELERVISANERNLASMINVTPARAELGTRIEADKKKLADLRQSLLALEDERRRAGIARPRS
jgi:hypothetical protein